MEEAMFERSRDLRRFHPLWIILPVLAALTVAGLLSLPAVYFGKVYFHELQVQEARTAAPAVVTVKVHTPHEAGRN